MPGKVFLIPNTLGDMPPEQVLPVYVFDILKGLDHFIVENIRTARRFLIRCGYSKPIDNIQFFELNKRTPPEELGKYLEICKQGKDIGIISEAGVPGVADPGAEINAIAHSRNIRIVPLVGPSSILMSVMASGLNGQNFCFSGYLPIKGPERTRKIKELENNAIRFNQTQLFIETPYRNNALLEDILRTCRKDLRLCIACDISLPTEYIKTKRMGEWKINKPDLHKRPTIFLIGK